MEGYTTIRCHMGVGYHSSTISSSQALRTRFDFQGGEHVRVLTSLTPQVDRVEDKNDKRLE
jgi:hypothetical protein